MTTKTAQTTGLGPTIREARQDAGFTQDQVVAELAAHGAPVTQQTYSRYESGLVMPSSMMLGILADVFGVDAITALEWLQAAARSGKAR